MAGIACVPHFQTGTSIHFAYSLLDEHWLVDTVVRGRGVSFSMVAHDPANHAKPLQDVRAGNGRPRRHGNEKREGFESEDRAGAAERKVEPMKLRIPVNRIPHKPQEAQPLNYADPTINHPTKFPLLTSRGFGIASCIAAALPLVFARPLWFFAWSFESVELLGAILLPIPISLAAGLALGVKSVTASGVKSYFGVAGIILNVCAFLFFVLYIVSFLRHPPIS